MESCLDQSVNIYNMKNCRENIWLYCPWLYVFLLLWSTKYIYLSPCFVKFQVGDPELVFKLSQSLLEDYGIYVQPINYPTVARGMEMLRVAPTPHHTPMMMEYFVTSLVSLWKEYGLELKQPECGSCKMTLNKKYWDVEMPIHLLCNGMNCSKYLQVAIAW